tara:strand:+ start:943 stop:1632 length:690 start_codon:yes stop_codon:yes gene_type:complete
MSFSLIIPCYNEEKNIKILFSEIYQSLQNYKYELIIIDDCSEDNSVSVIKENNKFENLKLIINKKNQGQSFCIYEGVGSADYDIIVTLDADGQNNPFDIPNLLTIYQNNKNIDLVAGIRKSRKDKLIKIISSKIANYIRQLIFNDKCSDTGCSLKVFNKESFLRYPYFDGIHRFIPALFKGLNKTALFIDVDHRPRKNGISKYGTIDRALKGFKDIFKVLKIIKQINND